MEPERLTFNVEMEGVGEGLLWVAVTDRASAFLEGFLSRREKAGLINFSKKTQRSLCDIYVAGGESFILFNDEIPSMT